MEDVSSPSSFLRKYQDDSIFGPISFAGISLRLQERIRDLEQTLREERRALTETEQRYATLEEKYRELVQQQAGRAIDPIARGRFGEPPYRLL